jgi:hypothetical protein
MQGGWLVFPKVYFSGEVAASGEGQSRGNSREGEAGERAGRVSGARVHRDRVRRDRG